MNRTETLHAELQRRVLVLDGAMGTMLQRHALTEEDFRGGRFAGWPRPLQGCNDLLSLTRPEIIRAVHDAYLEAGADIIETNTFNANRFSLADYGLEGEVAALNEAAARLARQAVEAAAPGHPRFVAGSMGPTGRTASLSPDVNDPGYRTVTFDELAEAYAVQAAGLLAGGADLLLVETVFDTLNAKAALYGIEEVFTRTGRRVPVMVSATISDASGRTLSGQTVEAFLISTGHFELLSIGLNCALGARALRPHLEVLARRASCLVSVHPNAGLPDGFGQYTETPESMAAQLQEFLDAGLVNIAGGCCGTTPAHIAAIAARAAGARPRIPPPRPAGTWLAGLEPLCICQEANFINIGERTNVAGSRKFARLIREEKFAEALAIARQQVESGAQVLDVNMDDALLDAERSMTRFLNLLAAEPDIAKVPVMLDSSRFSVLRAGLRCLQGKAVVNSISLKEGEAVFLEQAREIRRLGAAVVVMAFDEEGQAVTFERKIAIVRRAFDLLVRRAGFMPEDIIFDTNVLTIATGLEEHDQYAVDFLRAVRWIKENLPGARTSGGISNLSFSFRGNDPVREAMHAVFLYHAIREGLDMAIVNAGALPGYEEIPPGLRDRLEDVIFNRRGDATERLVQFAATVSAPAAREETVQDWRLLPLAERIRTALIRGLDEFVEADMAEALGVYPRALDIIEGPLMEAMNTVGDLFGAGKMFLPQVVKTARVMKKAVACLQPAIEAGRAAGEGVRAGGEAGRAGGEAGRAGGEAGRVGGEAGRAGREAGRAGKILLATVKGDVHDIGKNIAGVVLACNNFEIVDLGVMVPCEKILQAARDEKPDLIGLSGLITPSLEEMRHVAREMEREGFRLPLLIGGATTSKVHTAVKIAPCYSAPVLHVKDASKCPGLAARLMSPAGRETLLAETRRQYEELRQAFAESQAGLDLLPLAEARRRRLAIDWDAEPPVPPRRTGRQSWDEVPLSGLRPYINWQFFFLVWQIKGKWPALLDDPVRGPEARRLYDEAQAMLDRMESEQWISARAVWGIFPANAAGDDLEVYEDENRRPVKAVFYQLRQQNRKEPDRPNLCLSDFLAPRESGRPDWLGALAVTAGHGVEERVRHLKAAGDDYRAIMLEALADRLAEALAELVHRRIRREDWGYAPEEPFDPGNLFREKYQGIRPAPGYPACPDHSEKETLFRLLDAEAAAGITLTGSFAMQPAASVSALVLAHPRARYFPVDKLGKDQIEDYARRKGITVARAAESLAPSLGYEP